MISSAVPRVSIILNYDLLVLKQDKMSVEYRMADGLRRCSGTQVDDSTDDGAFNVYHVSRQEGK